MGVNDAGEQLESAKAECVRLERELQEATEKIEAMKYEVAYAVSNARVFVVGECMQALSGLTRHRTGWFEKKLWLDPFEANHAVFKIMSERGRR